MPRLGATARNSTVSNLGAMAKQARDAMGVESLSVVADRSYFKSEEVLACHEAGITAFVPKIKTSAAAAAGRFSRDDFIYDAAHNEYRCPTGERLRPSGAQSKISVPSRGALTNKKGHQLLDSRSQPLNC